MKELVIPDFEDMVRTAEKIGELIDKKLSLEVKIKDLESKIVLIATTDSKYMQNGKPPSMSFIESTYKYTGLNGELIEDRLAFASTVSELEKEKLLFDIMRMQIDLYRTESANQRKASL